MVDMMLGGGVRYNEVMAISQLFILLSLYGITHTRIGHRLVIFNVYSNLVRNERSISNIKPIADPIQYELSIWKV